MAHIAKPKNWYSKYTWKSFYNEYKEGKQPDRKIDKGDELAALRRKLVNKYKKGYSTS